MQIFDKILLQNRQRAVKNKPKKMSTPKNMELFLALLDY